MEFGPYYQRNQRKLASISEAKWKETIAKCIRFIELKLKKKTLYGAHAGSLLGAEAVDHYISVAYERIISGYWEFQDDMDIAEQMMRVITSYISKAIEHTKTVKATVLNIKYTPIEEEFYEKEIDSGADDLLEDRYASMIKSIEDTIKDDIELEIIWEAIKEGKTRYEIAELLDKTPRQFDKLREKLIRMVQKQQLAG
ncbi:MAG: hypothetical protein V4717_14635 [Bacteroidota bacterium]